MQFPYHKILSYDDTNNTSSMSSSSLLNYFATTITPWIGLIAGGQFFMAGCLHVFWSDGGKYRVAGFDVKRFDDYTHSVLMFMSCIEGSPQLLRGLLMITSVWSFPQYTGPLIIYDALDGLFLFLLGGYFFGGVKPVPSPPRGEEGTLPGSKLHAIKMTICSIIGMIWLWAGRPVADPLPLWTIIIPFIQVPVLVFKFTTQFPLPKEAEPMVNDYLSNKDKGAVFTPFAMTRRR